MDKSLNINGLIKKTERLEYEDGLRNFQFGAIFLVLGLANGYFFTPVGLELFARALIRYQDLQIVGLAGLIGLTFLLAFGSERVMERIRRALRDLRQGAQNG